MIEFIKNKTCLLLAKAELILTAYVTYKKQKTSMPWITYKSTYLNMKKFRHEMEFRRENCILLARLVAHVNLFIEVTLHSVPPKADFTIGANSFRYSEKYVKVVEEAILPSMRSHRTRLRSLVRQREDADLGESIEDWGSIFSTHLTKTPWDGIHLILTSLLGPDDGLMTRYRRAKGSIPEFDTEYERTMYRKYLNRVRHQRYVNFEDLMGNRNKGSEEPRFMQYPLLKSLKSPKIKQSKTVSKVTTSSDIV